MKPTRRALIIGSMAWAVIGAAVAVPLVPQANADVRWIVRIASLVFPAAAAAASVALSRGALRWAGVLLLLSVATPTYMAYPLNLPALVVGLALVVSPAVIIRDHAIGSCP